MSFKVWEALKCVIKDVDIAFNGKLVKAEERQMPTNELTTQSIS